MRIVFFGTSDFAVPSLAKLADCYEVAAVVTKPNKPKGRHLLAASSAVKVKARELGIPAISIEGIPVSESIARLKSYRSDLFVVIAYGQILPIGILSLPKLYSIGLHASLLPKYRGASPISSAILNGEVSTGVTVFKLAREMDAGEIITQEAVSILETDDSRTLSLRLSVVGADLLLKAVEVIGAGQEQFICQGPGATLTSKLKKEDGLIDWKKNAFEIRNKIRAMFGWPGAFSVFGGHKIKILKAETKEPASAKTGSPGEIVGIDPDGIIVSCGQGAIKITGLQAEGGKPLSTHDYLLGHKILPGDFFL